MRAMSRLAAALAALATVLSSTTFASDKIEDAKTTIKEDTREVGQSIAHGSKEVGHAVAVTRCADFAANRRRCG